MQLTARLPAITYNMTAVSRLPTISFALTRSLPCICPSLVQTYLAFSQSLLFRIYAPTQVISPSNRVLIAPPPPSIYHYENRYEADIHRRRLFGSRCHGAELDVNPD